MASTSETSIFNLPIEIWENLIFPSLNEEHLKPLSLVSKTLLSITNLHKKTLKITVENAKSLPSLLKRFPNLKHIDFSNYSENPDQILPQIADFINLETLILSNHEFLPVDGLGRLPSSIRNGVKSFKISFDRRNEDQSYLDRIAYFFPNLEELGVSRRYDYTHFPYYFNSDVRSRKIMADSHGNCLSNLRDLRRIVFEGYGCISDDSLIMLCRNCPKIEEIVLYDCPRVTLNGGVGFALNTCMNLKSISLGCIKLSSKYLEDEDDEDDDDDDDEEEDDEEEDEVVLCWPRSLATIELCYMKAHDGFLQSIAKANLSLNRFTMSHCPEVTHSGITSFLKSCNSLVYLDMRSIGSGLTDDSILAVAKFLTNAMEIKLNGCKHLSGHALFHLIEHCPMLKSVEMVSTGIRNGNFTANNNACVSPMIRHLDLSKNDKLGDDLLTKLSAACPNLEKLILNSCRSISNAGVSEITRNCGLLRHLWIKKCCKVSNVGLVSKTTSCYRLESLVASQTSLNDKALIDVADKCPNLEVLKLKSCIRVTCKGVLEVVDKCTKLEEINIKDTMNMSSYIVAWMACCRSSLTKISYRPRNLDQDYYRFVRLV